MCSWEADEQSGAIRRGVGGAKGRDRGECGPTKHVLDSVPDKRDLKVGSHTATCCRPCPRWEPYAGKPQYGSGRGARGNSRPYREIAVLFPHIVAPAQVWNWHIFYIT